MRIVMYSFLLASCAATETPDVATSHRTDPPLQSRLHDESGAVDGVPLTRTLRQDPTHCTGLAVDISATGTVDPSDRPLADVLAISFPWGLDSSPALRQESESRFRAFTMDAEKRVQAASRYYKDRMEAATRDQDRVVAAARITQLTRHFASMILRAEIPVGVRTGEYRDDKIVAYCAALADAAQPLLSRADNAARDCRQRAAALPAGWWTAACSADED